MAFKKKTYRYTWFEFQRELHSHVSHGNPWKLQGSIRMDGWIDGWITNMRQTAPNNMKDEK